jgi:hypothetical protein
VELGPVRNVLEAFEREGLKYAVFGAVAINILTRLGEAFRWSDLEIVRLPFEGLTVSVCGPRIELTQRSCAAGSGSRATDAGSQVSLRRGDGRSDLV